MISPGPAESAGTRSSASVTNSSPSWPACTVPSARHQPIRWPLVIVAVAHAADRQAAEVGRGVEVRDHRLQRVLGLVARRRDVLEQQVEQRHRGCRRARPGPATPSRAWRPCRRPGSRAGPRARRGRGTGPRPCCRTSPIARVGPVDLVDVEDHRQPRLERLAQDEARLRQRALGGVDEQQDGVDHRQAALDLAAEVGVAGRVDDVDLHALAVDRGVLGEDRDAALALEIHRVHDAGLDLLVRARTRRSGAAARRRAWSCRGRRARRSRRCAGRRGWRLTSLAAQLAELARAPRRGRSRACRARRAAGRGSPRTSACRSLSSWPKSSKYAFSAV